MKRTWYQCPTCLRRTWQPAQVRALPKCDEHEGEPSPMVKCDHPRHYPCGEPAAKPERRHKPTFPEITDTRKVTRRVGKLIVRVERHGIRVRYARCRRAVFVHWEALVKLGLQNAGVALKEREWREPIKVLAKLAYHLRVHGGQGA